MLSLPFFVPALNLEILVFVPVRRDVGVEEEKEGDVGPEKDVEAGRDVLDVVVSFFVGVDVAAELDVEFLLMVYVDVMFFLF